MAPDRNISRRIAVNVSSLFLARVLASLLSLVVAAYLARYLGKAGYGDYSFVFAYLVLFQSLTGTGIDTIVVKEITRDPSRQDLIVGNAVILRGALSLLGALSAVAAAQFLGFSGDMKILLGIASLTLLFGFGSVYTAVFHAHSRTACYAVPEFVIGAIFSLLMLVFIRIKASIAAFIVLQSVLIVPVTAMYIYFAKKVLNLKGTYRFDPGVCRSLLAQSWPFFASSIFSAIYMRIDQVMLFRMVGSESVGLYSASTRLTESLNIIPFAFNTSLYPLLCESFGRSREAFSKLYRRSLKYMGVIILPIAFGTTLLSARIIRFFYGDNFLEASAALGILIWAEIFNFLSFPYGSAMTASGVQRFVVLFTMVGAAMNVALNLFLIPRYGIVGASVATLLSYGGFGLILQYYVKDTRALTADYLVSLVRPTLCAVPMSLFVYAAKELHLAITIPLAAGIYFLTLIATKTIDSEDVNYVKSIFQSAKTA